ncbi:MAG TPA: hypothetical protein VMB34_33095 [Acetobacteraceae bacterium]|nr:hypothetical protein [Acetobacteraceae bacterium]
MEFSEARKLMLAGFVAWLRERPPKEDVAGEIKATITAMSHIAALLNAE